MAAILSKEDNAEVKWLAKKANVFRKQVGKQKLRFWNATLIHK
ncbi:hypothetical protein ACLJJ6_07415 [Pediococcus siamensis]